MRAIPEPFKTRQEVDEYFNADRIECLLCRQRFRRLGTHLAAKHQISADEYRTQFGLPWTRGLTSETSHTTSGWSNKRKAAARRLAHKSQFFKLAHLTPRRQNAPFLRAEAIEHLGKHAIGFGEIFEKKVRRLFEKGLTDAAIARKLHVGRATVTYCTTHWRKRRRKRKS